MPFCRNCGKEVSDGAKFCVDCGTPTGVAVNVPVSRSGGADSAGTNQGADRSAGAVNQRRLQNVENHIVKAVISTLLCIPFGVVAIVFAARVKPALGAEDYEAAQIASKKANLWGNLALIIGIVISAILVIVTISLAIPQFSEASAKAKLAEAPRIIASFESGYLAAVAENGNDADITDKELIFNLDDLNSKWFKYEYVTYPQGGIAGLKATALENIGKFNKGSFLQTVYQEDSETFTPFTHCVGGNEENVSVVEELIPNFNATVECSSVEVKKASDSAPAQSKSTGSAQSAAPAPTRQNTAYGTFTDSRDGKKYKIVKVGTQTWMAENLNYAAKGSVCYENNAAYCVKYGRLYDWTTAKKACPAGFHLPTDDEWTALVNYAGGEKKAGKKLKSKAGWNNNGNGTDDYGWSALPGGGGIPNGSVVGAGYLGNWWSATEDDADYARTRGMYSSDADVGSDGGNVKSVLYSVRCVQDLSRNSWQLEQLEQQLEQNLFKRGE